MPFDVEGAIKAGYTTDQIADFLAEKKKFNISGARKAGYSDDQIIEHLNPKLAAESMLEAGVGGAKRLVSSTRTALEAPFVGGAEAGRAGVARQEAIEEKPGASLEQLQSVIKERGWPAGILELGRQVPRTITEQVPNLLSMAAGARLGAMAGAPLGPVGAGIGALGGAAVSSYLPQAGANIERQVQETPETVSLPSAYAAAVPQAAIDVGTTAFAFGKLLGISINKLGTPAAEKLAEESLKRVLLTGSAKTLAAEVPGEVVQQALERYQAGLPLTTPDAIKEYTDTAYATSMMAPVGGASRLAQRSEARGKLQEEEAARQQEAARQEELDKQAELARQAQIGKQEEMFPGSTETGAAVYGRQILEEQQAALKPEVSPELVQELSDLRNVYDIHQREYERLEEQYRKSIDKEESAAILEKKNALEPVLEELKTRIDGIKKQVGEMGERYVAPETQGDLFAEQPQPEQVSPEQAVSEQVEMFPGDKETGAALYGKQLLAEQEAALKPEVSPELVQELSDLRNVYDIHQREYERLEGQYRRSIDKEESEAILEKKNALEPVLEELKTRIDGIKKQVGKVGGRYTAPETQGDLFAEQIKPAAEPTTRTVNQAIIDELGLTPRFPLYHQIKNLDLSTPEGAKSLRDKITEYADKPKADPGVVTKISNFLKPKEVPDVGENKQPYIEPISGGVPVSGKPVTETGKRGAKATNAPRVGGTEAYTAEPTRREGQQPGSLGKAPTVTPAPKQSQVDNWSKYLNTAKGDTTTALNNLAGDIGLGLNPRMSASAKQALTPEQKTYVENQAAKYKKESDRAEKIRKERTDKIEKDLTAPKGTKKLNKAELEKLLAPLQGKAAKKITIVDSVEDLPAEMVSQFEERGIEKIRGAYDAGSDTLYMVASQIENPTAATFVALHEAAHRGLRKIFGNDLNQVLVKMYDTNKSVREDTDRRMKALPELSKLEAVEEVLADRAGEGTARELNGWKALVKRINDWLKNILGVKIEFTDDMVEDIVAQSRKVGLEKAAPEVISEDIRASAMEIPRSNKDLEDRIYSNTNMPEPVKNALYIAATNLKDWAKRATYSMAFGHDLADLVSKIIPSAKAYFNIVGSKESVRTKHEAEIDAIVNRAYAVKDKDALNNFLQASTMKGKIDPDAKKALSKEAQDVAMEIFEYGRTSRLEMQDLIDKELISVFDKELAGASESEKAAIKERKLNAMRMFKSVLSKMDAPYAPLARFGNFVTVAKSKKWVEAEKNNDVKWMKDNKDNGEHYIVEFHESLGRAKLRAKQLERIGFHAEGSAKEAFAKGITEAPWSAMRRLKLMVEAELGEGSRDAVNAKKHINSLLSDLYLSTLAETSARKHDIRRENVTGASKDMLRAFVSKGKADAHFMAALNSNGKIMDTLEAMRTEAGKFGPDRADRKRALNEILTRHALGMQYTEKPIQDKLMQFNSIWTLLTKPAYYFQNLTQPWMMSVPVMARKTSYVKAISELTTAMGQLAPAFSESSVLRGFMNGNFNIDALPIKKDEKEMLHTLKELGILDVGISRDLGYWESRGGLSKPIVDAMHKMNTWVRQVETINRVSTALASYRLEGGGKAGVDEAIHIINTTHGNYSASNAPRLWSMVPMGNVILQFRKFQFIQASLIIRLAANTKYGSPAEKAAARKALGFTLAHYGFMTGIQGLPAMALVGYLAALALGEEDEPVDFERWFTKNVADGDKDLANLYLRGAPSLVGLDLTGMLGAQNMLSILPYTDINLAEKGGYEKVALGLMGSFVGGTLKNGVDGANLMLKGDYYKGMEKMLPSGFSKAAQSYRLASEGYTNSKNDMLMGPEEFTGLVATAQALGLRTGTVADIQKATGQVIDFENYYRKRTSEITHRFTKAAKEGDDEARSELIEEFRQLQESKRRNGFKTQPVSNLFKAVTEQRKRERSVIGGVQTTKSSRRFVRELVGEE